MAYQSLYRRYRPQRFAELQGQDHVSTTLANAVREGRTSHAYLFSGPRGTGKTSTARILAKALNCHFLADGEPCNTCPSCVSITEGTSLDVFELDAASHNGVEAMRDLVTRAALGTPGRWKVYIVDECHMLSAAASNALLKTLEEPPGHVVFVLATTEARKVLPTIRSRTQHLEFRLLPTQLLADHLRRVADDAGLGLAPEVIDLVARRGNGSVRDALSALDQAAAAGGLHDDAPSFEELVEALCERDLERAITAVAERCDSGHDPRQLTSDLLAHLRNAFLVTISRGLVSLPDADVERVESQARRLGRASTVRALELLGETLVQMRESPEPRVSLEVALVRLCSPETDPSPAALLERIERLERREREAGPTPGTAGTAGTTGTAPGAAPTVARGGVPARSGGAPSPTAAARAALRPPPAAPPASASPVRRPPAPAGGRHGAPAPAPPSDAMPAPPAPPGRPPTRDELTLAWADVVLDRLSTRARARFRVGRFVESQSGHLGASFALPNAIHRDRCAEVRTEVEEALARHFGTPVELQLLVESEVAGRPGVAPTSPAFGDGDRLGGGPPADPGADDEEEAIDPDELTDAPPAAVTSPVDQVLAMFEGTTVVEQPES